MDGEQQEQGFGEKKKRVRCLGTWWREKDWRELKRLAKWYSQCRETSEIHFLYSRDLRVQNKSISMTLPRKLVTHFNWNGNSMLLIQEEITGQFQTILIIGGWLNSSNFSFHYRNGTRANEIKTKIIKKTNTMKTISSHMILPSENYYFFVAVKCSVL